MKLCERHTQEADLRIAKVVDAKADADEEFWSTWWSKELKRQDNQILNGCCLRERVGFEHPMITAVAKKHGH